MLQFSGIVKPLTAMGDYKFFEDIIGNVTLVQLMDSLGNVNHAISVVGSWIFDSNYERVLVLNKASLDMIFAPSVGEEQAANFDKVYYAVRYILNEAKMKIGYFSFSPQNSVCLKKFIKMSDTFILERN